MINSKRIFHKKQKQLIMLKKLNKVFYSVSHLFILFFTASADLDIKARCIHNDNIQSQIFNKIIVNRITCKTAVDIKLRRRASQKKRSAVTNFLY